MELQPSHQPQANPVKSLLLNLPLELRRIIWHYVIAHTMAQAGAKYTIPLDYNFNDSAFYIRRTMLRRIYPMDRYSSNWQQSITIFQVNQSIYREATEVLCGSINLEINCTPLRSMAHISRGSAWSLDSMRFCDFIDRIIRYQPAYIRTLTMLVPDMLYVSLAAHRLLTSVTRYANVSQHKPILEVTERILPSFPALTNIKIVVDHGWQRYGPGCLPDQKQSKSLKLNVVDMIKLLVKGNMIEQILVCFASSRYFHIMDDILAEFADDPRAISIVKGKVAESEA